jgi:hypothetical protein
LLCPFCCAFGHADLGDLGEADGGEAAVVGGEAAAGGGEAAAGDKVAAAGDCLNCAAGSSTSSFLARPGAMGPRGTPVGRPWLMTSAAADGAGVGYRRNRVSASGWKPSASTAGFAGAGAAAEETAAAAAVSSTAPAPVDVRQRVRELMVASQPSGKGSTPYMRERLGGDVGALAWLGVRMGAGNVRNGPGGYE